MKRKFFFLLSLALLFYASGFSQYVTASCNGFTVNGSPFRPLVVNYCVDFYSTGSSWYVSPNGNYTTIEGSPYSQGWRYCYSTTDDQGVSNTQLASDLALIANQGFTTVRILGIGPINNASTLTVKCNNNYTTYFSLLDNLLTKISNAGLRAILLVGPERAWDVHESFKYYLESLAYHYKNNTTILAYDIMVELNNTWRLYGANDKYRISNLVTEWCDAIKKHDTNHLISAGPMMPETCIAWDPLVMPIDYLAIHYYAFNEDLTISQDIVDSYLHWTGQTISKPWIIGETGFSGTSEPESSNQTGSEASQNSFSIHSTARTLDCGGQGYSWWQFRDINWASDWENFLGTYRKWNGGNTSKTVSSSFGGFLTATAVKSRCTKPSRYYNLKGYSTGTITGTVLDNNSQAIANAVVWAMDWDGSPGNTSFITYTQSNGAFSISTGCPVANIDAVWVSAPGYSTVQDVTTPFTNSRSYTLRLINTKGWTKKWTNSNSNTIGPWNINSTDKFYTGDFNGDGEEEILCCQTGGTNDLIKMLAFDNDSATWELAWSNNGDPNSGQGIYYLRNNLVVGNFDGTGGDDIIGFNTNDVKTFKFYSNNWYIWETNNGTINNPSYPLSYIQPYQEYVVSGNFDGTGGDDLLCSDLPSGWTAWFSRTNGWQRIDSDQGQTNTSGIPMSYMRPYRDQFIVGDFDADGKDEVLGNDLPNGYMTVFKIQSNSWQWIWSDNGSEVCGMRAYRNNLTVGDFDLDSSEELIGLNSTGAKFDFSASSFTQSWNTGTAYYLSDWDIYPAANKYLALRTNSRSKEQLLGMKSSLVGMYSLNTKAECTPFLKNSHLLLSDSDFQDNLKLGISEPEIFVYPNPTLGKANIVLTSPTTERNWKMHIYDIRGQEVSFIDIPKVEQRTSIEIDLGSCEAGVYFIKVLTSKETLTARFFKSN